MKTSEQRVNLSSVEKLIRLPPLKKLSPQENPFPISQGQLLNGTYLSNNLRRNLIEQRQILRDEFYKYENDPNFSFYLPESKFPSVPKGQQNQISYQKRIFIEPENTFRERLSPDQIEEIKQKGQFTVKSQREWVKIPYIWQLNDTIFKGINRVRNDWNERMSLIHSFAHQTWIMITQQFPQEIVKIIKFPYKFFCLLVGKKSIKVSYSIDYSRQVAKDFWNEVMSGYYSESREWFSQLWNFLDTRLSSTMYTDLQLVNETNSRNRVEIQKKNKDYEVRKRFQHDKIQQINKISLRFDQNWQKVGKKIFMQISQQVSRKYPQNQNQPLIGSLEIQKQKITEKQQQILERFKQQQLNQYTTYLSQQLPKINVPSQVIEALLTILTLINLTVQKERQFQQNRSKQRQRIQKLIKQKHPILSTNYSWYQNKVREEFQHIQNNMKQNFYQSFIDQKLDKRLSPRQVEVFKLWVECIRNYQIKIQQKKQLKKDLYQPQRIFQSSYSLLPPYQIIRHQPNTYNNQVSYQIVKSRTTSMSTGRHCWKFFLYLMRLKTWAINCFVVLIYSCLKGTFGLRCLCGIEEFSYDQDVNMMTGEIIHSMRKTVLGRFYDVIEGIQRSRADFQALPDTGLFGKTCSRLYNLIQCYVFRFLIVGVLIILTLYPIAILIVSLVSFFLIITIWAWIPIVLLVTYLFNIFIFKFQANQQYLECFVKIAPFFVLLFKLLFSICKVVFYVVSFFIITPLVSIAVFLYACICFCMRSIGDSFILCFIRCCGHTPNTNSVFATKVSGPDMASQQFMSLNEQDIYILVQSQLQQIHLQLISKLTMQKISQPFQKFKNTLNLIIQPLLGKNSNQSYGGNSINFDNSNNPTQKNSQLLLKKFYQDFTQFKKRYPLKPRNVRFNSQQLANYLHNTQQIVRNYVIKNQINEWIFDHFKIALNDYQELNKKIWIDLFQCGQEIFQPLQNIDQRFRLQDQYNDPTYGFNYNNMKLNVNQVANAIRGQVSLKQKKVMKLTSMTPNLYNRRLSIIETQSIFDFTLRNTDQNVYFSLQQPTFIFFPHLSIKELSRLQQTRYLNQKEKNASNWDKKW